MSTASQQEKDIWVATILKIITKFESQSGVPAEFPISKLSGNSEQIGNTEGHYTLQTKHGDQFSAPYNFSVSHIRKLHPIVLDAFTREVRFFFHRQTVLLPPVCFVLLRRGSSASSLILEGIQNPLCSSFPSSCLASSATRGFSSLNG